MSVLLPNTTTEFLPCHSHNQPLATPRTGPNTTWTIPPQIRDKKYYGKTFDSSVSFALQWVELVLTVGIHFSTLQLSVLVSWMLLFRCRWCCGCGRRCCTISEKDMYTILLESRHQRLEEPWVADNSVAVPELLQPPLWP